MDDDDCCVQECCCHQTDTTHVYRYRPVNGTSTSFSVKCSNDAHVCLNPVDHDGEPMIQIFIGGWHNKKSGIRLNADQDVARVDTPDIVSQEEFRRFWISWDNGHIKVGHVGSREPFMTWNNPDPFPINYLGYTTGWGSTGEWKFHDEAVFETKDGCGYHFREAHGSAITFSVQTPNDAHIALTPGNAVAAPMYEIFVGGWGNSKSAIRYTKAIVFEDHISEDMATAETPDILSGDEMRAFTVSWADGHIRVSRKGEPEPFLEWKDPEPIDVTHFGYCTKWGADGQWRFEV